MPRLKGDRFPREIVAYAVWLYHRFALRPADVENLLADRGVMVSRETIRKWVNRFSRHFADCIRRNRPAAGDKWQLDEVVTPINCRKYWLWLAVDATGDVIDILVLPQRNAKAARRFLARVIDRFGERFSVFQAADTASDRLIMVASSKAVENETASLHVSHELTYIGQIWEASREQLVASKEVQHGMAADIRAYCLAGRGRGVLPASLVEADIEAGRLVICPLEKDIAYTISLYCSPWAHRQAMRVYELCTRECMV